jgi:Holliday junction resolvase
MGSMGVFDIVACADGVFVGIECKSDSSKKPTALQTHNATKAKKAGGVIFLVHVDNITDLEDTIIQIKGGERGTDRLSFWPFSG